MRTWVRAKGGCSRPCAVKRCRTCHPWLQDNPTRSPLPLGEGSGGEAGKGDGILRLVSPHPGLTQLMRFRFAKERL